MTITALGHFLLGFFTIWWTVLTIFIFACTFGIVGGDLTDPFFENILAFSFKGKCRRLIAVVKAHMFSLSMSIGALVICGILWWFFTRPYTII